MIIYVLNIHSYVLLNIKTPLILRRTIIFCINEKKNAENKLYAMGHKIQANFRDIKMLKKKKTCLRNNDTWPVRHWAGHTQSPLTPQPFSVLL